MPTVKIRAQVLIAPLRAHASVPAGSPDRAAWPKPANAQVVLTPQGGGPTVDLGGTDNKGTTRLSTDLALGTYKVELPGHHLEADDLTLRKAHADQTLDVILFPYDGHYLVMPQLTEQPAGTPVEGAGITITSSDGRYTKSLTSDRGGRVYASVPEGDITLEFTAVRSGGRNLIPSDSAVTYTVQRVESVQPIPVEYWPAIQVSVKPAVKKPDGIKDPLTGADVTVEYRGSAQYAGSLKTGRVTAASDTVSFEYPFRGIYVVTVRPPATFAGLPIKDGTAQVETRALTGGQGWTVRPEFEVAPTQTISFRVVTPGNQPLTGDLHLQAVGPGNVKIPVTGTPPAFTAELPSDGDLEIQLDPAAVPKVRGVLPTLGDVPLELSAPGTRLAAPPGTNTIALEYQHSITVEAVDEDGQAVPGARIDVFDEGQNDVGTVTTGRGGRFLLGLPDKGIYFLGQHPAGGQVEIRERVEVQSNRHVKVPVRTGTGGEAKDGEAFTDLAVYPVLTEEITTTGVPAPAGGGTGGGGRGAGYGQTVDQVIRDVLGWRPGGDAAGFQAALAGAFQLRQVEGHTEWTWQQRGYAVQADMGALTGAQASIYARAKSALDQILPLLAGLTTTNPALYPPQDLEAIRTVIVAELNELVSELGWEGGPRIQRVDELFGLLLGDDIGSTNLNPDLVQGQLGRLRDRFGLTVNEIDTVDEERIVTNFRIVVEQILTLQASWSTDRNLLSVVDSRTSLGTILIRLNRALEAVCESVGDLAFALDSVFVDAAQRQVVELRLGRGEPPLLLSDLLDWVLRASRDEGPRIVQDAGKDGVFAFAPVLDRLRTLVNAARQAARTSNKLPDGMRTPRVDRAFQVLASQLADAARLARLVRRDQAPLLIEAQAKPGEKTGQIAVTLLGANFRRGASAVLIPENRDDLADLVARNANVKTPGLATATFRTPAPRVTWLAMLINDDGAESDQVVVQFLKPLS